MVLNLGNVIIPEHPSFYNVKDFGAVGDNVTNDWGPITAANIAAEEDGGGTVYYPPLGVGANDRYRIESPLYMREGVSWLGGHAMASRISAHGTVPNLYSIVRMHATVTEEQGFFIQNLTLGFQAKYNDSKAKVIDFNVADPQPKQYMLTNLVLRNGYYGYHDSSSSFQAVIKRVWAYENKFGIYKAGGGLVFDTCFVQGSDNDAWDQRGWWIEGGGGNCVLTACAQDFYKSSNVRLALFKGMSSFTIKGLVFEANESTVLGGNIVRFENLPRFSVSGLLTHSNVLLTNAGNPAETVFIIAAVDTDTRAFLSGMCLGAVPGAGDTVNGAGGTGTALTIVRGKLSIVASDMADPISGVGGPAVFSISMPNADACALELSMITRGATNNPFGHPIFFPH